MDDERGPVGFDEIYDALTVHRIEQHVLEPAHPGAIARFRRGAAGAALTTALVTGVREAIEPEAEEVLEEIDNGVFGGPSEFVSLFYVPNDPRATLAVVRPWLAPEEVSP